MIAFACLLVFALLLQNTYCQVPPVEDCQAKFEEMGTNALLSQFQPCQQGVTEQCCERGQGLLGYGGSLGACLCHPEILDELVQGINSNSLARAVGVTGAGVQDALQQCGVPFANGAGESQCPSFDQTESDAVGDDDGDEEQIEGEVITSRDMWDEGTGSDSSKGAVGASGGEGLGDGKGRGTSSPPPLASTTTRGDSSRGLFPRFGAMIPGGLPRPDASLPFGFGDGDVQDRAETVSDSETKKGPPTPTEHNEAKRRRGRPDLLPIGSGGIVQASTCDPCKYDRLPRPTSEDMLPQAVGYQAMDTATNLATSRPFQMFQNEGKK